jgi:WXG100 family type VII secretion target
MEILARPDELIDHGRAIASQVAQTTGDFNAMKSRLDVLSTQFRGSAATAFEARWNEWHTHATGLIQALENLGKFLGDTAETVRQVDDELARRAQA